MSKGNEEPIKTIVFGAVTGSIFENKDKETGNKWFSVSIQKFYNSQKNENKKAVWEYTNNYNLVDLPNLALVSSEIYKYIQELRNKKKENK